MALLCEHGEPLNYSDADNNKQQNLGVYLERYGKKKPMVLCSHTRRSR